MTAPITLAAEGYDELAIILRDAFLQASEGKGAERHANSKPFHAQPMQSISDLFDSDKGMAFQIVKKLREGLGMPEYERLERELLGVIVYTAGAILWHKRRHVAEDVALVAAVEPPITFKEHCAEIDAEIQDAVRVSLCVHCGRAPYKSHAPGCPHLESKAHSAPIISEEQQAPDMSDPANWLPGDMVMAVNSTYNQFTKGMFYELRGHVDSVQDSVRVAKDDTGHPNGWGFYNFVWHSRPTK